MFFTETILKGAFIIDLEKFEDERGFFARSWCEREFVENGIYTKWVQTNISLSYKKGTLRGMHYRAAPYTEEKLVRCINGMIHDVILDLRPKSLTYRKWISVELSAKNRKMIYIPKDFAHGFITMVDNCEVFYMMSEYYLPGFDRGIRWNDPSFSINWPFEPKVISDRDKSYPDFVLGEQV